MKSISPRYFPVEKLEFFEETGGVGVEFSQLPFDLIIFTGSGATTTTDFASLIAESIRRHGKAADELMEKIKDILPNYSKGIPT